MATRTTPISRLYPQARLRPRTPSSSCAQLRLPDLLLLLVPVLFDTASPFATPLYIVHFTAARTIFPKLPRLHSDTAPISSFHRSQSLLRRLRGHSSKLGGEVEEGEDDCLCHLPHRTPRPFLARLPRAISSSLVSAFFRRHGRHPPIALPSSLLSPARAFFLPLAHPLETARRVGAPRPRPPTESSRSSAGDAWRNAHLVRCGGVIEEDGADEGGGEGDGIVPTDATSEGVAGGEREPSSFAAYHSRQRGRIDIHNALTPILISPCPRCLLLARALPPPLLVSPTFAAGILSSLLFPCFSGERTPAAFCFASDARMHAFRLPLFLSLPISFAAYAYPAYILHPTRLDDVTASASASVVSTTVHSYAAPSCGCRASHPAPEGTYESVGRPSDPRARGPLHPARFEAFMRACLCPVAIVRSAKAWGMRRRGGNVLPVVSSPLRDADGLLILSSSSSITRLPPDSVMHLSPFRESCISLVPCLDGIHVRFSPMTSTPLPSKEPHLPSLLSASLTSYVDPKMSRRAEAGTRRGGGRTPLKWETALFLDKWVDGWEGMDVGEGVDGVWMAGAEGVRIEEDVGTSGRGRMNLRTREVDDLEPRLRDRTGQGKTGSAGSAGKIVGWWRGVRAKENGMKMQRILSSSRLEPVVFSSRVVPFDPFLALALPSHHLLPPPRRISASSHIYPILHSASYTWLHSPPLDDIYDRR
ncbi:hypothetical protein R3P38DRAFT_3425122 [Favolaschia claudopus]|uniref:Uncharacterized protein n=1 Tax=Favolaschia claudopus TaxID=2862362 RepID=A0AAV9ZXE6_9AGAR